MSVAGFTQGTAGPAEAGRRCPVCQTEVAPGEVVGACPGCEALYHADCWAENGGCGTYGCAHAPAQVAKDATAGEGPVSFWGQEEKVCPACRSRIKVAALRCRFCGLVFAGRAPDAMTPRSPVRAGGKGALVLFVAGLLPVTAPAALVVGAAWLALRRRELSRWPATRRVLAIAGVAAAAAVTLAVVLTVLAYTSGREAA